MLKYIRQTHTFRSYINFFFAVMYARVSTRMLTYYAIFFVSEYKCPQCHYPQRQAVSLELLDED